MPPAWSRYYALKGFRCVVSRFNLEWVRKAHRGRGIYRGVEGSMQRWARVSFVGMDEGPAVASLQDGPWDPGLLLLIPFQIPSGLAISGLQNTLEVTVCDFRGWITTATRASTLDLWISMEDTRHHAVSTLQQPV